MKSKKKIYITIITIIVLLIGLSYAFFVLLVKGNDNTGRSVFRSGHLEVTLDGTSIMASNNLSPGDTITKTFTVKNTGSVNSTGYTIYFSNLINNFEKSELVYTLACSASSGSCNGVSQSPIGTDYETTIVTNAIAIGVTQTYTLSVSFIETSSNQDYNKNKTFTFVVKVNETEPYLAEDSYSMDMTVDFNSTQKTISPYIYGINEYYNISNLSSVKVNAIRQGGNRYTTFNWENNASNAGLDWLHSSDNNLGDSNAVGYCATRLSDEASTYDIDYKLATLQMAGYVAADKNGIVLESEVAPSLRWKQVIAAKGSAFTLNPSTADDYVYMDEYVNYLKSTLGSSTSSRGINGYILDNETELWNGNHPRIVSSKPTINTLITKSVALSKAIKAVDANAEIYGPALSAFSAYVEYTNLSDWQAVSSSYNWFIDYYLQQMKAQSDTYGSRLLDVFDVHYFSEDVATASSRVQAVRTLYESGYAENSWIGTYYQRLIPLLGKMQDSISTYYPGTKLSITEYSFGGGYDASGAVAQAEALGAFADNNVYLATYWGETAPYVYSAINMYTNYDGSGSSFGNTLIKSTTSDISKGAIYSGIDSSNNDVLHIVITNKDASKTQNTLVTINDAPEAYDSVKTYYVSGTTGPSIVNDDLLSNITSGGVSVMVPPMSVVHVVLSK